MKTSVVAVAFAGYAAAFPSVLSDTLQERAVSTPQQDDGGAPFPQSNPPFNATAQRVSTSGANAWVAPTASDSRGECPGLNALANHGYLPHNGFATIQQFIDGTYNGVGMERDLGGFLAVYGALVDGNGAGWLIGGAVRTGILGSHHNYEADSSPLKSDLNQYGSNTLTIKSQFLNLYNRQPADATANYNLAVLRDFRASRFNESIAKNPYFFYGPFDGVAVSQAAFTFIYRFMSNKSAEHPEGVLNRDVLKSWMSFTGPDNNLTHTPGYERIPDNWYKRNPSDSYSIPYFISDVGFFASKYPQILSVGCNTGTVNSYTHLGFDQLSGNAYKDSATSAGYAFCFTLAATQANIPNLNISAANAQKLTQYISPLMSQFNCTKINNYNTTAYNICPGFSLYGGPNGPVAPGAIQTP